MSRVGNKPLEIPADVTIKLDGAAVNVEGKLGKLSQVLPKSISAKLNDGQLTLSRVSDEKHVKALHGTMRSLLQNMIIGVSKGYVRELGISGVGFKAELKGNVITLNVGFSHPVNYELPEGVEVKIEGGVRVIISGIDKQVVGQVAAHLRAYWPADPYKAKGISYKGEHIRRKAGKTVA